MKSSFFRPRSVVQRDWGYDLPEGKLATPAQSAEYRRRRRRVGLYQGLTFLSLPLLIWFGVTYLQNPALSFIYLLACPVGLVFLVQWIGRSFCCPVCGMWFVGVDHRRWKRISPERLASVGRGFAWCESCGDTLRAMPKRKAQATAISVYLGDVNLRSWQANRRRQGNCSPGPGRRLRGVNLGDGEGQLGLEIG